MVWNELSMSDVTIGNDCAEWFKNWSDSGNRRWESFRKLYSWRQESMKANNWSLCWYNSENLTTYRLMDANVDYRKRPSRAFYLWLRWEWWMIAQNNWSINPVTKGSNNARGSIILRRHQLCNCQTTKTMKVFFRSDVLKQEGGFWEVSGVS